LFTPSSLFMRGRLFRDVIGLILRAGFGVISGVKRAINSELQLQEILDGRAPD
jgi:hypothetical protein